MGHHLNAMAIFEWKFEDGDDGDGEMAWLVGHSAAAAAAACFVFTELSRMEIADGMGEWKIR